MCQGLCLLPEQSLPVALHCACATACILHFLPGLVSCSVAEERDCVSAVFVNLPAPQNSDL